MINSRPETRKYYEDIGKEVQRKKNGLKYIIYNNKAENGAGKEKSVALRLGGVD